MKTKNYTKIILIAGIILGFTQVNGQVVIENDPIFNTADQMLLANELFESGEPFAEALGYDLDDLDPMVKNAPDSLSYATGIEGYEYSRYLLNTLNGRSGLGLHIMWSPIVTANAAAQPLSFDGSFTGGVPNGFKEDDMLMMMVTNFGMNANQTPPQNAFPQFADFISGDVNLPQVVASDFQMDWSSTRWDRTKMVKELNLGAMGQSLWKQYYWAADMLGAFHDSNNDGIDADGSNSPDFAGSPDLDPNNNIFYGGNNIDGFIGQVLTAVSINKTMFLINNLAFDGTNLGAIDPMTYNPSNGIKFFPHKIALTENIPMAGLPPKGSNFSVIDASSYLFDQISYLLGTASYVNMMNPNDNSDSAHYAYHEVFDGSPFPADMATTGTAGPFDLMRGTSMILFQNLMAMHFNSSAGTFVDVSTLNASGEAVLGNEITAENTAYTIIALSKLSEEFSGMPIQTMADNAIMTQADFILTNFIDPNGGYYNSYTIGTGPDQSSKTIEANAFIIRALYAAYNHTSETTYLNAANTAYNFMINNFYSATEKAFITTLGDTNAVYTPKNLAFFAGALREAKLTGNQTDAAIIYARVSQNIYNQMLLTEHESTGETGSDSDGDGIPYVAGGTKPFVFAAKGTLVVNNTLSTNDFILNDLTASVYPNPAKNTLHIDLNSSETLNEISIYDVLGQTVKVIKNIDTSAISLNVDNLNSGHYFIRLKTNHNNLLTRKFIKN